MRADAHVLALRAIESILDAAAPMDVDVAGTRVSVAVARGQASPWPMIEVPGCPPPESGLLPAPVDLACTWNDGKCTLRAQVATAGTRESFDGFALQVLNSQNTHAVVWRNFSKVLGDGEDGERVPIELFIAVAKRATAAVPDPNSSVNAHAARLLVESGLPRLKDNSMRLAAITTPTGEMDPPPADAFRLLVRFSLLKLDLIDGAAAAERGKPLVNLVARGVSQAAVDAPTEPLTPSSEDETRQPVAQTSDLALNLILYGPPGTGKTYHLRKLFDRFIRSRGRAQERTAELVDELRWYQVLALGLDDIGGCATIDQICAHPYVKVKFALRPFTTPLRSTVYSDLAYHTIAESKTVGVARRHGELLFDKLDDGRWKLVKPLPEDLVATKATLHEPARGPETSKDYKFVTLHQAYGYEDFIEGIRPRTVGEADEPRLVYRLEDGVFKRACRDALRCAGWDGTVAAFCQLTPEERRARLANAPTFALFIDEINRGNVARIFGELITLIESDKRLGAEHEMIAELPYSGEPFGVPSNLHVIGTMNTADRSIDALDTALRRRFEFREMPPKPQELSKVTVPGVDLVKMLTSINGRLEKLLDRDHTIGHAWLIGLGEKATLDDLKRIFKDRIIPLLQEYFFGDWGKIGLVLGERFVRRRTDPGTGLAKSQHDDRDDLDRRVLWQVEEIDGRTDKDFQSIYRDVADG